jgi:hypothetical protein
MAMIETGRDVLSTSWLMASWSAAFSNTESPPSPGAGTFSAAMRSWDGALQFRSGFA